MPKLPNTPDEILSCARSLIIAGGYNGFSYADIAEKIGVRKASIHYHFAGKVNLVSELVRQHRGAMQEGLASLEASIANPLDQLSAYINYWKNCIEDLSSPFCLCALLAGELPVLPDEVAVEVRSYFQFLSTWMTSVFERGAATGSIRLTYTPGMEAELLMATVHGAMLSARAYDDASIFGTILETQLHRFAQLL